MQTPDQSLVTPVQAMVPSLAVAVDRAEPMPTAAPTSMDAVIDALDSGAVRIEAWRFPTSAERIKANELRALHLQMDADHRARRAA